MGSLGVEGGAMGMVRGRSRTEPGITPYVAIDTGVGDNLNLGFAVDRVGPILCNVEIDAIYVGQHSQHGPPQIDVARSELAAGDFHVDEAHSTAFRVRLPVATIVTTRRSVGDGSSTTIFPAATSRRTR